MTALTTSDDRERHRLRVVGVVQGVGFRPFVHRLATELDLAGHVGNDSEGVFVEVEGAPPVLGDFELRLRREAPPLARIHAIEASAVAVLGEDSFRIVESRATGAARTFVSPDFAVCDECLSELFDPKDRRYRYPFINCTNCGPRFTITVALPYDRPNTTMAGFPLCPACMREYEDPADRRFHAQPLACAKCGPRLWLEEAPAGGSATPSAPAKPTAPPEQAAGATQAGPAARAGCPAMIEASDAAIEAAQRAVGQGEVVAVKGLGGYHLACDATSDRAVAELRRRKHRADKPFAVMVRDLASAEELAVISRQEAALLTAPQRPIVLLRKRHGVNWLSSLVAPANADVGLLLPYTPVHHLLFEPVPGSDAPAPVALVMTSGNLGEEPICYDDDDARRRLGAVAGAFLCHDRPIHVPCDDSVIRLDEGEELPIRRSRGYAPLPVRLPFESEPLLAAGGELKNTFCLASGRNAWMSQHIGDMGSLETLAAFERSTRQFAGIYQVDARRLAADAHPGYQTRRWAEDRGGGRLGLVQHHHAHVAAVMVEHHVPAGERVIGCAFDGTGYGRDGAIWGGEVLLVGYDDFERIAHLRYVPLPGGDTAVRKPYRVALAHLFSAGIEWSADLPPVKEASAAELRAMSRQLERGVHCTPTSSMGRLFDSVSSLIGLRHTASYEAQAAIELEAAASEDLASARLYRFAAGGDEIDPAPVLRAIVADLRAGCPAGAIAAGFHLAVARLVAEAADALSRQTGLRKVALSGGVFQNVLLVGLARAELTRRGLEVLTHRVVPPNDGGLALGQVAALAHRAGLDA
jgi:hydrogenase maturation protein HypF